MATTAGQRQFKRGGGGGGGGGRPAPPSTRVGAGKDHFTPHPLPSSMSPANLPGVYSNPDMAYALVAIVGCVVDVQMQSGVSYQGVLKAVSPQLSVALELAHNKAKEPSRENTERLMQLEFADIVSVSVLPDANGSTNIFKTDTEISRTNGSGYTKELQPFTFDDDGAAISLNDESSGWDAEDMFEINRTKFNVESSFNEDMPEYTTKLDRADTKDFWAREKRAEKLAREIEKTVDKHGVSDIGTEEELFSAVVRQEVALPPSTSSKPKHAPTGSRHTLPSTGGAPTGSRHTLPSTGGATRMVTEGHSYSAVAENSLELRLAAAKGSDSTSSQSQVGSSLSETDGSSSQEFHQVHTLDVDNPRGAWTSQSQEEPGLSLSGENSFVEKGPPLCGALEEGSQESLGQATVEEEEGKEEEEEGQREEPEEELLETTLEKVEEAMVVMNDVIPAATEVEPEAQEEVTLEETTVPPGFTAQSKTPRVTQNKEENVRKFQLDPNAKTFSLNVGAIWKEFVPTSFTPPPPSSSLLTQSSSSPSVLESSSSHTPHNPLPGKKVAKRLHNHTSSATPPYTPQGLHNHASSATPPYTSQDSLSYAPSGSFIYSPSHTMVRNSIQQLPNQQMIQYSSSVPQFLPTYPSSHGGGFITPQTQHLVNNGQKFVSEQQVFSTGTQPYSMHVAPQHQLIQQQQVHGQILTSVPQQYPTAAQGGLVTAPPSMLVVQGGQGGMYQQVPVAMAQVAQTQVMGPGQNRYPTNNLH